MTIWKPQYNLGSLVSTESKPFSRASIITKILKSTETDSAVHVPRNFCFTRSLDFWCLVFSQFSRSVVSDSLQPHESQHARPPCPSPTPRVYSNSCPLSQWCHPTISSCRPLLLLPPIPPNIRVFSNESTLRMRWPKYWSSSFRISPSNEHPGLICFRMDWLDLLAVQGTLKSLLQHHSSKVSSFRHSAFFTVQLSHPYMTTGKTIALTRRTFVGKVMSLFFNMLSRLVITFLPRSKLVIHIPSIGRTDSEAETPILWPPDANSWLIQKNPDAGKDWRQEENGMTEDELVGWHHRLNRHKSE